MRLRFLPLLVLCSCADLGDPPAPRDPDAELFGSIGGRAQYAPFPGVDSVTAGSLNGSSAHRPLVRVRINARAEDALVNGFLPSGGSFPDGAVILKEILDSGGVSLLAVMKKDRRNELSAGGWLWAEYEPDGAVFISVTARGSGCIGCHMREDGPRNDLVRTFERRRPFGEIPMTRHQ